MSNLNIGGGGGIGKNDKVTVSGLNSNFDFEKIIEKKLEIKSIQIKKKEDEIDLNNKKTNALFTFKSKIAAFQQKADIIRNSDSLVGRSNSAFDAQIPSISINNSNDPASYMSVATTGPTTSTTYKFTISQLAQSLSWKSSGFSSKTTPIAVSASANAGQFTAGTFQINGKDITLATTDSLSDISFKINNAGANVTSSVVSTNAAGTNFILVIESNNTGAANAFSVTDSNSVLNGVMSTLQNAADSNFTFDGVPISRSTNTVSDLVPGIQFTMSRTTSVGETLTVGVNPNVEEAMTGIADFINSYNELVKFYADNTKKAADGRYEKESYLANDYSSATIFNKISSIIAGTPISSSSLKFSTLNQTGNYYLNDNDPDSSPLGITFYSLPADPIEKTPIYNNLLKMDPDALQTALTTNWSDVRKLFEFTQESTSSYFEITGHPTTMDKTSFSVSIDTSAPLSSAGSIIYDGNTYSCQFVPNNASDLTKGGLILGTPGSPIEDLKIRYIGTGVNSGDFTVSYGIADQLFSLIDSYSIDPINLYQDPNSEQGTLIDITIKELTNNTEDLQVDIDNLKDQADMERRSLIQKFSTMESRIGQSNYMKTYLEAVANSQSKK